MTVTGNMNVSIDGGAPWGFRLQGGGNFPLQVLKVRKRSKSQRHLVEGDIIIKVNGIPTNGKTHEAVMDMVDATVGPVLNLEIYRGESLQKIPKKVVGPTPFASVAPASQKSATSSSARMSEHSQHRQTTEESMYQKKMSSQQQMSQKSTSVFQQQQQQQQRLQQQQKQQQQQRLQQQHQQQQYQQQQQQQQHQQQQQVTKSNIVLKNQAQQQKKVTQIQQSSQWQQQQYQQQQYQQKHQQQHMTVKQQQKAMQHQQLLREQQQLAEQQMAEQQMARKQLAEQRQHVQTQHTTCEQENIQTVEDTSSVVEQSESVQEEESTTTTTNSVSTAIWTSGQSSSLDKKQTNLVLQAYTSSPKPYKPKVAGHLPLRPCSPSRPSPCPSPAPATPIPAAFDDKENWAPSPVPSKPPTPAPNVPQFNVKNIKGIVNQNWNEVELEELNLPIPDYSKKMPILPLSSREPSPLPTVVKKTIEIPDMTIRPGPPVAPKPKRVLSEVQTEPLIPDHEIVPIYTEDRPHLPVFGPPVMYGLNPALAPKRSTSMGEEESVVSEASSGSRRNNPNDPKKQKIYSDSSFYYDPKGVYPTIEDQIDLCKKISQSLTAAANTKARGATMFAKRQKRSIKWIHDGYSEGNVADLEELSSELDQTEGGTKPLFQFRIPKVAQQVSVDSSPKMSLSREEFETMRTTQPKVDHTAVNPNACMSIISDLQNSKGRGAKLFAKRQARCDKWVIDDKTSSVSAPVTPSEPPCSSPSVSMMNAQNRLADMITQPMPIIQPKPKPAQKAPLPDPPVAKKNMGVPLPTVNANLQAEFKSLVEGPNFNRTAKGWNAAQTMPQSRAPRAQSVQPSSTKGPPPPVAPKPGKCMKHNPRPTQGMGDEQPPLHYRSSSDQLRLLSPRDPYHDASGYCSDVDHRTKVYAFKKPGMFRPKRFVAGAPMSQPVFCSDL